uniref:Putative LOC100903547 [Metaseiulus occidentalis] n=1 Tax=Lepeophtheirus salmonis TaxID=72036 RepID=A0A0K2SXR1_LEPSM
MLISTCVNNIEFIVCIVKFNNSLFSLVKMSNFVLTNYDVRTSLIFCYQLKKTASRAHLMLVEAYGGHVLSRAQCFRGFEKFQSVEFDVRNDASERRYVLRPVRCLWYDLLQPDQTVNGDCYQQQLTDLNQDIRQKCPKYEARQHKVIFIDDNLHLHRSIAIRQLVESYNWEPLAHVTYSPDLAPTSLPSMSLALNDLRFNSQAEAKNGSMAGFQPKTNDFFFWKGIHKLPERWKKCVATEGAYFEN